MKWFEKFIDILKEILLWPCYLIFTFIGAILLIIALLTRSYFEQIWIFFLFSISGLVWRYIEKDMLSGIQKVAKEENKNIWNLVVISFYHIGNLILLIVLFYCLNLK